MCSSQVSGFSRVPLNHAAYLVAFSISFVSASYIVYPTPCSRAAQILGRRSSWRMGFVLCHVTSGSTVLNLSYVTIVAPGFLEYLCNPGTIQTWGFVKNQNIAVVISPHTAISHDTNRQI